MAPFAGRNETAMPRTSGAGSGTFGCPPPFDQRRTTGHGSPLKCSALVSAVASGVAVNVAS